VAESHWSEHGRSTAVGNSDAASHPRRSVLAFDVRAMMSGRVNGKISAKEVRIVDESGEELGVFCLADGLSLARSRGEDLIEIDAEEEPPLCRVMDYGKYRWQLQQSQKDRAHD